MTHHLHSSSLHKHRVLSAVCSVCQNYCIISLIKFVLFTSSTFRTNTFGHFIFMYSISTKLDNVSDVLYFGIIIFNHEEECDITVYRPI